VGRVVRSVRSGSGDRADVPAPVAPRCPLRSRRGARSVRVGCSRPPGSGGCSGPALGGSGGHVGPFCSATVGSACGCVRAGWWAEPPTGLRSSDRRTHPCRVGRVEATRRRHQSPVSARPGQARPSPTRGRLAQLGWAGLGQLESNRPAWPVDALGGSTGSEVGDAWGRPGGSPGGWRWRLPVGRRGPRV
jgi:hypothetical protein